MSGDSNVSALFALQEITQNSYKYAIKQIYVKNIYPYSIEQKKIYVARSVARCARTSDGYTKADVLVARAFLCQKPPVLTVKCFHKAYNDLLYKNVKNVIIYLCFFLLNNSNKELKNLNYYDIFIKGIFALYFFSAQKNQKRRN